MTLTLDDLNNFIKSLMTVKSSNLNSCLVTEKHSSFTRKFLVVKNWSTQGNPFPPVFEILDSSQRCIRSQIVTFSLNFYSDFCGFWRPTIGNFAIDILNQILGRVYSTSKYTILSSLQGQWRLFTYLLIYLFEINKKGPEKVPKATYTVGSTQKYNLTVG